MLKLPPCTCPNCQAPIEIPPLDFHRVFHPWENNDPARMPTKEEMDAYQDKMIADWDDANS